MVDFMKGLVEAAFGLFLLAILLGIGAACIVGIGFLFGVGMSL